MTTVRVGPGATMTERAMVREHAHRLMRVGSRRVITYRAGRMIPDLRVREFAGRAEAAYERAAESDRIRGRILS